MNLTCPEGWSHVSDLSWYDDCSIHLKTEIVFKLVVAMIAMTAGIVETVLIINYWKRISRKATVVIVITIWIILHNLLIITWEMVEISLEMRAVQHIALMYTLQSSCCSAAITISLFLWFEINIVRSGSLKDEFFIRYSTPIMTVISSAQIISFLIIPLIPYSFGILFWMPVLFLLFTLLPYLSILAAVIHRRINQMEKSQYQEIARQFLITAIVSAGIGLIPTITGIYSMIDNRLDWLFLNGSWIAQVFLNASFFFVLIKKKSSKH